MRRREVSTLPHTRVRTTGSRARCALFTLLLVASAPATLAAQVTIQDGGIVANFQNAELAYVLSTLARAAGINIFMSDIPSKLVSLNTPRPLTREQAAQYVREFAVSNGITVVDVPGGVRLQGVAPGPDPRQLYFHQLKHARAPVLAATLQQLFGGIVRAGAATGQTAASLTAQLRAMETQIQQQQRPGQGPVTIVTQGAARGELEGAVVIVADEVTNSLIIRATPADWQVIQQAVGALDLRPLQVVIEVVIAEVRRTDELNVGVSLAATDGSPRPGQSTSAGISRTPGTDDFTLRIVRTGDIDIDATLSALARSGNVRVLSRPVVLAQNNQRAVISVGEQRPFIQVSRSLPTGEPVRDQVVQYLPVATSLTITPTINADGYVNLSVLQEVNTATNEVQFDAPVISERRAETQLLARNGQTVVIGGLVDRQRDRTRSGIPLLKDIPIIGFLFGSTRDNTVNSELFLFLTPYVVGTDEDADRVREAIERNAEQLKDIVPITPIIPRIIRPDTIGGGR